MLKIITLGFEDRLEGFDNSILEDFLSGSEVVSWRCSFFERKNRQYLSLLLEYNIRTEVRNCVEKRNKTGEKDEYKTKLKENDWPLFERLREWRKKRSNEDGIPPYIIFTNNQLAQIALSKPASSNGLQSINGVGEAKRKKYGKEILGIIGRSEGTHKHNDKGRSE